MWSRASGQYLRDLERRHEAGLGHPVVPGRHNVLNALACFATLTESGMRAGADHARALGSFTGAVRRFH